MPGKCCNPDAGAILTRIPVPGVLGMNQTYRAVFEWFVRELAV